MKVGVIGLGDIATKAYLPILATNQNIEPWICTRNPEVLQRYSQQYRIKKCYEDFHKLISDGPDIVFIHSATDSHYAIAKACLNAGIPTFIDKPISYSFAECEDIIELAKQKKLQLHIGFNRRFAPLYKNFFGKKPIHIYYQKNRFNLPADPRVFVYDDFIHVLDTLLFLSKGKTQDLNIQPCFIEDKLASIWVNWRNDGSIFTAEMNRVSGMTEELLQFTSENEKWHIANLSEGIHYSNNQSQPLKFNDWENTLKKRGFVDMINHVLHHVNANLPCDYDSMLASHRLCEIVVQRMQTKT